MMPKAWKCVVSRRNVSWIYFVRVFMATYLGAIKLASIFFRSRKCQPRKKEALDVLLTGNFYSDNWIYAQLRPLVLSQKTKRIRMVAETPVPALPKVEPVYPSRRLSRWLGKDVARLLTFVWLGVSTRPDVVGGFHLLVNGMLAILVGRLTGARSLYVCGGGAREAAGGGYACENKIFGRLGGPDDVIERQLLRAVSQADIVVARGQRTIDFFEKKGVKTRFYIVPAGIDGSRFKPVQGEKKYDLSLMGRLTEIKRVDTYLRAIALVARQLPEVRAAVIGDGPLLASLETLAQELGITGNVDFLGHRDDVDVLLPEARIFVLTSDSEGLSQAMIQAMLCGLPAVVSDVGDLKELIEEGENGYLVKDRTPEAFAEAIMNILESGEERMALMSVKARESALRCDVVHVAKTWDGIFDDD